MTPDLIIQLIASATGTGGLIALFLITEKKTTARLENTRRIDEKWQSVIARQEKELELLSRRYEANSSAAGTRPPPPRSTGSTTTTPTCATASTASAPTAPSAASCAATA